MDEAARRADDGVKGDPLADVLTLAGARCLMSGSLSAGGRWAVRFPPPRRIKFFAVVKGACWLLLDGDTVPVRIETGDVFMLPAERPFLLAGDLAAPPLDGERLFAAAQQQEARVGDGQDFFTVGGHLVLHPQRGAALAEVLPPLFHVRGTSAEGATLHWLIAQLRQEVDADRPGATLASEQLAQLMFVHLLRSWLATSEPTGVGWLRALVDERVGPALRLLHQEPARAWTVAELAKRVGMSRTSFALRFKAATGEPPLRYLWKWRMRLAERELRDGSRSIAELALLLGYASESAFSNAFKQAIGLAPTHYRARAAREDAPPPGAPVSPGPWAGR